MWAGIEEMLPFVEPDSRPRWLGRVANLKSVFPLGSFIRNGELHPMEVIRIAQVLGPARHHRLH